MSSFSQYPFEASYIKSYNLINHGEAKYNLYTEDDSDNWFWEKFIDVFFQINIAFYHLHNEENEL